MQIKTTCKYTIINTLKKNPDYLEYVVVGYFYHCNISLEIAVAINLVRVFVWSISFRDGCVIKHTKLCSDSSHIPAVYSRLLKGCRKKGESARDNLQR